MFFGRRTRASDGLRSECKDCRKRYQKAHQEHISAYKERYKAEHTDEMQAYQQRYYKAHRETKLAYQKGYQQEHTNEQRTYKQQYYQQHRESTLHRVIQYSEAHKEQIAVYQKQYAKTPTGKAAHVAAHGQRRARKLATPGTLTKEQIKQKLKAQRYRCYYAACGHAKFEKQNGQYIFHLEHTIPLSRPEGSPCHDLNHVVLACPSCNLKKHARFPHEWPEGGRLL